MRGQGLPQAGQSTHNGAGARIPEHGSTTMDKSLGSGSALGSSPDPVTHMCVSVVTYFLCLLVCASKAGLSVVPAFLLQELNAFMPVKYLAKWLLNRW